MEYSREEQEQMEKVTPQEYETLMIGILEAEEDLVPEAWSWHDIYMRHK